MRHHRIAVLFVILCLCLSGSGAMGATVTVDTSTRHQTIDGFGGFGPKHVWWSNEAARSGFFDDAYVARLIDDLGLTIIRDEVPPMFEFENDDNAPGHFNWPRFNMTEYPPKPHKKGLTIAGKMPFYRAMKAKAEDSREPLKFISSIWSPPPWMKTNKSTINGGSLVDADSMRAELAEFCAAYVKTVKRESGVDLYALSIQNELAFVEPYNSCVYSPDQFAKALRTVGERFEKEGLATRIFGPECMGTYTRRDGVRNYLKPLLADREGAGRHLDVLAVHSYKDGVAPDYGDAPGWTAIRDQAAAPLGVPVWMTETGVRGSDWSTNGMDAGRAMYVALKYGNASAWVWWYIRDTIMANGETPKPAYYASKHYCRFVRPGAVMVEAGCEDGAVLVTAFRHEANGCLTVVMINNADAPKKVALSGTGLPAQFELYQSTPADPTCSAGGTVPASGEVGLPATSMTTLVAGEYRGTGGL